VGLAGTRTTYSGRKSTSPTFSTCYTMRRKGCSPRTQEACSSGDSRQAFGSVDAVNTRRMQDTLGISSCQDTRVIMNQKSHGQEEQNFSWEIELKSA